jgi:hypothetical protein
MPMQITITHNRNPIAMLDGLQPGDDIQDVFTYSIPDSGDLPRDAAFECAAEHAYFLFNAGETSPKREDRDIAASYRALGLRSLSVGDMVKFDDAWVALACEPSGWMTVPLVDNSQNPPVNPHNV